MLNSTIFYELPWCCNCMYRRHKVSLKQIHIIVVKQEAMIIIWRIIPWWRPITITANHSNYLVCDRANTQSVTVRKVVKLQLNYCNALVIMNLQYRPVRREERGMFILIILLMYMPLSDVSLRRQASMTQAEKFPDPFCSRAMLICSIIWLGKRMLRVVVLRVLFFVDDEGYLYSVSLICNSLKLFLR